MCRNLVIAYLKSRFYNFIILLQKGSLNRIFRLPFEIKLTNKAYFDEIDPIFFEVDTWNH